MFPIGKAGITSIDPQRLQQLIAALKPSPWVADLFPAQREVHRSKSRWKCVTTSRRGGKTILLTALAAEALEASGPDEVTLYIAKTRSAARELIWQKLKQLAQQYSLAWDFNESTLRVTTQRGGVLLVRAAEGSDPQEEREKLRGLKLRRALLDEVATYTGTLKVLLRDIIEPSLGDLQGDCILTSTPGFVKAGAFYDISSGSVPKWECFRWTIRDNPHFLNAEKYLADVLRDNGWTPDHPTYQREYEGQWSTDSSVTVYRYVASHNLVDTIPEYSRATWVHTLGVDFGMVNATSWTVVASHPHKTDSYVIKSFSRHNLLPDEVADITHRLVTEFQPYSLVGDSGGLGKPYVEAYNRRYGGNMVAANKTEKLAYIRLINGDFQSGKLKLLKCETEALAAELEQLPWADETQQREHPAYLNDRCDSLLYSWRKHRAYLHEAPKPREVKPILTPDSDEWLALEIKNQTRKWWDRP